MNVYGPLLSGAVCVGVHFAPAHADTLRIASHNVKYLSACVNYVHKDALQSTFESLNADIIAFQKVRNRQALEYFFDTSAWNVIIDDQSTDDQKLAFVVREGVDYRLASGNHLDAEKSDFLFPDSTFFPDDRDVLRLFVNVPELDGEIEILNHHAKSRYNCRVYSEALRIDATSQIVDYLRSQSVSYELSSRNTKAGVVDPTIIGSRDDNYLNYSDEHEVTKVLYDNREQIQITSDLGYRFDDSATLRDEAGNRYEFKIQIASGASQSIVPTSTRFSLNNNGDRVERDHYLQRTTRIDETLCLGCRQGLWRIDGIGDRRLPSHTS